MASAVFGILLPANGFIAIIKMLCCCGDQTKKVRMWLGILLWLGLLIVIFVVSSPTSINESGDSNSIWPMCILTVVICAGFFLAMFGCIRMKDGQHAPIDADELKKNRRERTEEKHGLGDNYRVDRICNNCGGTCKQIQSDEGYERYGYWSSSCKECNRYMYWSYDRTYRCDKCDSCWCVPCGNKVLKKIAGPGGAGVEFNMVAVLWTFPMDEYVAKWIRLKWANIIQLIAVIIDWLLMVCV